MEKFAIEGDEEDLTEALRGPTGDKDGVAGSVPTGGGIDAQLPGVMWAATESLGVNDRAPIHPVEGVGVPTRTTVTVGEPFSIG